ncbi:NAD(P)-dependent oxidoreductase [Streptomyces sp. NBC_00249]|uniref:NAD-dependent epimerase/dehydratase family protein n=1 Tax=Streptomyces sp. NBC_00249 TaxID=2975690 RepID=UPI00225AA68A|nr:NAD(P)-dependent oxidoreductase [Streptomyces sp. NBC_00249]MCX5192660.1 NAD(P)-dependent oxidoreductase [Streptomyces sp. NBC_00249]
MTHPRRLDAARELAGTDPRGRIQVVTDPEPDGPPTALRSGALAWQCVDPEATHHLVLQDDVVLAEGFYPYVEQVAAAVPDEAVAFYAGWDGRTGAAARLAALAGQEWTYALEEHTPCLGLMLPARAARGYAAFAAEHGLGWPYDVVVQRYLNSLGVPIRVAVPSTVDHSEVPSIAGNTTHGWRQAAVFTSRAPRPATYDCAQFAVVPFYQYGDARCAVRQGPDAPWEYVETGRYLSRIGLAEHSRAAHEAAPPAPLPERVAQAVWETAYMMGVVVARVTAEAPEPAVTHAVMDSVGPGGLCEEYTAAELGELIPPVRELGLVAFEAGRAAESAVAAGAAGGAEAAPGGATSAHTPATATVTVTGGEEGFGPLLTGLLEDLGHRAVHRPEPDGDSDVVVHLGSAADGADRLERVLAAAEKAGTGRLLYVGSAQIYRGVGRAPQDGPATEDGPAGPPSDPAALRWWLEEERVRRWGEETGTAVQVLRAAEPLGPGVLVEGTTAHWMHRAWTREPLQLDRTRRHQVLDHRDLAAAVDAVLAAEPLRPVFNVASQVWTEEELAELVALIARRTAWEDLAEPAEAQAVMATGLIESELDWRPSAPLREALRALAQWLACDTHRAITGLPQLGRDV